MRLLRWVRFRVGIGVRGLPCVGLFLRLNIVGVRVKRERMRDDVPLARVDETLDLESRRRKSARSLPGS